MMGSKNIKIRSFSSIISVQLFILVVGCLEAGATAAQETDDTAHQQCPSSEFDAFLDLFANNIELQKHFIKFPLKYTYTDNSSFKLVNQHFKSFASYSRKWPSGSIFPTTEDMKNGKVNIIKKEQLKGGLHVMVGDEEPTFALHYYFKYADRCWFLYWIDDKNL